MLLLAEPGVFLLHILRRMLRNILFLSGLASLLTIAAVAAPTEQAAATSWRPRGYRHHRPSQGDYVPVYASYRHHSRTQRGLLGFLHRDTPAARHRGKHTTHAARTGKRTTGLF